MTPTSTDARQVRRDRRQRLLRATAIGILCVAAAGCNKFESKQLIRKGNTYFKAQQYQEALAEYQKAQALDPGEVRISKFIAMANMALYNPGSQHPKDLEALSTAIANFKKYLTAHPEDEKAAKYLVTTYMNAAKYDDAIAYFKDWYAKHPQDNQAVQTIAMLYAKKGDFENSMEWQRKRAQLEPTNADVFYTMGVTAWDKSYNSPPDLLPADKRKAILDEGMQNLVKATQLRPDYFEAMLYINLLYREYAKMETDPTKVAELKAKAEQWQKDALEARKRVLAKQREEQAAKNPLEAM